MDMSFFFSKVKSHTVSELFNIGLAKIQHGGIVIKNRLNDHHKTTYYYNDRFRDCDLLSYFGKIDPTILEDSGKIIVKLADLYCQHYFDLLGSGWTALNFHGKCKGFRGIQYDMDISCNQSKESINRSNRKNSSVISQLISGNYHRIDWNKDFVSGYRWSESTWYKDIPYAHRLGVDIKVPWELSRSQHFSQLAFAYGITQNKKYLNEFRDQILDFKSSNPPRFGPNWRYAMDVAIRAANWIIAYDLFKSFNAKFDNSFVYELLCSLCDHAIFIIENIEWSPQIRGNHYLSDITGLLFIAAFLPAIDSSISSWLGFAVREFQSEVNRQFNEDGSGFEASSCYHRLCGEMAIYGSFLILALGEDKKSDITKYNSKLQALHNSIIHQKIEHSSNNIIPGFDNTFLTKLERIAEFTMDITKNSGEIVQIGDNDNGRLFKLFPEYQVVTVGEAKSIFFNLNNYFDMDTADEYLIENHMNHCHLVAAANSLFNREDFSRFTGEHPETKILSKLINDINDDLYFAAQYHFSNSLKTTIGNDAILNKYHMKLKSLENHQMKIYSFDFSQSDVLQVQRIAYPDFGLYIFKSKAFEIFVRCGDTGQGVNGCHAHNDQLSITLRINDKDIISDPGTYVYTASPEIRNEYRSVKSHFAPFFNDGREPETISANLFSLGKKSEGTCLYFGNRGFLGFHDGFGFPVYRLVQFTNKSIEIIDYSENDAVCLQDLKEWFSSNNRRVSPGYGILYNDRFVLRK